MKRNFIVIFVTVLCAMISIATFNPIIGPLARELGLSEVKSGSLVTVTGICWIAGSFLWAKWARYSRKLILILALLGYIATLAAFAYVADAAAAGLAARAGLFYVLLVGLRALAGFFFGAVPAMAQAYLLDWTTADNRTGGMALFGAANGLGFVLGPALGAALSPISLTAPMYVSAVILTLVLVVVWMFIPPAQGGRKQPKDSVLSPFDGRIRMYMGIGLTLSTVMIMLQVTAGFFLQDRLAVSAAEAARMVGVGLSIGGLLVVIAQIVISRVLQWSPLRLLQAGTLCLAAAFALFALLPTLSWLSFLVFGLGIGFTMPGYTAAASLAVRAEEQPSIASYLGAVQGVGSFIGPMVGTLLYSMQMFMPYVVCIVLVLAFYPFLLLRSGRAGEVAGASSARQEGL